MTTKENKAYLVASFISTLMMDVGGKTKSVEVRGFSEGCIGFLPVFDNAASAEKYVKKVKFVKGFDPEVLECSFPVHGSGE